MLKYTLKNKKLEPSEELFFEELKLSFDGSSISGVLDNKYDLSDDETVQVINNNNKNVENLTLTSEKVLRQGWIYYMKEYQMYTVQCEFSSNIGEETVTNIYTIYYVIYNDSRYFQNYKIINDDSASSHIVFDNSFTISNVGTFSFSDNNIKYSRIWIPTKIYIEDGTIAIDEENTLYDGIDFNLLDTSVTYDEETKLYNSFINYNNISHPLFYYSVSNYRSVFKCVINSAKESNVIDVLSTYCAEKMDYINYNNEQCEIFKSVDGIYDFINVTKPIYRLYSGTGRYSDYEDYETCYSSATANGISVKNIVKISSAETISASTSRDYSDSYFYNDQICPNFLKIYNGEIGFKEKLSSFKINSIYTASTISDQIFINYTGDYSPSIGQIINYKSNDAQDELFQVSPSAETSFSGNTITIGSTIYHENANSLITVLLNGSEYDIKLIKEKDADGNSIGEIVIDEQSEKVTVYKGSQGIVTGVGRSVMVDDVFKNVIYSGDSICTYGSYKINGNEYIARKHSFGVSNTDKVRAIMYSDYLSGKLKVVDKNGNGQIRCVPLISETIDNDYSENQRYYICSELYNNFKDFSFFIEDNIFENYLQETNFISLTPSDESSLITNIDEIYTFYRLNRYITIPLMINSEMDTSLCQEDALTSSFASDTLNENINEIVDMERDVYYPAVYTLNNKLTCNSESICQNLPLVQEIDFNFHFRTRENDGWKVINDAGIAEIPSGDTEYSITTDASTYANYFCLDYSRYSGLSEMTVESGYDKICSASDLLCFASFSDKDVFYQKNSLSKTFVRLEFFDSPHPNSQSLLFYSTIYVDEHSLFTKYLNGINSRNNLFLTVNTDEFLSSGGFKSNFSEIRDSIRTNTEPIPLGSKKTSYDSKVEDCNFKDFSWDEDNRLSTRISVKDRYETITSSDGFYLYIYKEYATSMSNRPIYLKATYNHAGKGKIIQMSLPRYFYIESGETKSKVYLSHLSLNYAEINGVEYELTTSETFSIYDDSGQETEYRIKSELIKDLNRIKKGFNIKDIYYQQYIKLESIYDRINKRYVYYFPILDENGTVDKTVYNNNKKSLMFNLWELKINEKNDVTLLKN